MDLTKLLNACHINRSKFAKKLGVTKTALFNWEHRKITEGRLTEVKQELKNIASYIVKNT